MKKDLRPSAGGAKIRSRAARSAAAERTVVLHIDDDANDTTLLQAAARSANLKFRLYNVEDADEAIAYLSGVGCYADRSMYPLPSLILLDLKMPRTTGFEMLKWIRKHPELGELPVVVLSGSELQEDVRQAYGVGADSYLVKPIGFEALVTLVRNITSAWLGGQQQSC